MAINTIVPIVFSTLYLVYVFWAFSNAKKTGRTYTYKLGWVLASIAILGFCIYALITGRSITDFIG